MTLLYVAAITIVVLIAVALLAQRRSSLGPLLKSDDEIAIAGRDGRWLLAIKSYRVLHGVGLKQAKEEVSKLIAGEGS